MSWVPVYVQALMFFLAGAVLWLAPASGAAVACLAISSICLVIVRLVRLLEIELGV